MRRIATLVTIVALAASGCADLKNLATLSTALGQEYHTQPSVSINNGTHLRITFQNVSDSTSGPGAGTKEQFARSVAVFAKRHYPTAASLDDITIAFARVSTAGPLTVTRTDAPFTFRMGELP